MGDTDSRVNLWARVLFLWGIYCRGQLYAPTRSRPSGSLAGNSTTLADIRREPVEASVDFCPSPLSGRRRARRVCQRQALEERTSPRCSERGRSRNADQVPAARSTISMLPSARSPKTPHGCTPCYGSR